MRIVRLAAVACAALAARLAAVVPASADISPPDGLEWVRERRYVVENVDQFPDWVVIASHCSAGAQFYCVLRDATPEYPAGRLHAIRASEVVFRQQDGDAGASTIVKPEIPPFDTEEFLAKDRRVARSSLELGSPRLATTHENSGVSAATYIVRIERISAAGLDARFVRARYECGSGASVEREWGPDPAVPPVPRCPTFDDRSGQLEPSGAGAGRPDDEASFVASDPVARRFPYGRSGMFWLGAALASASLLAVGLLLRDRRSRAGAGGALEGRPPHG